MPKTMTKSASTNEVRAPTYILARSASLSHRHFTDKVPSCPTLRNSSRCAPRCEQSSSNSSDSGSHRRGSVSREETRSKNTSKIRRGPSLRRVELTAPTALSKGARSSGTSEQSLDNDVSPRVGPSSSSLRENESCKEDEQSQETRKPSWQVRATEVDREDRRRRRNRECARRARERERSERQIMEQAYNANEVRIRELEAIVHELSGEVAQQDDVSNMKELAPKTERLVKEEPPTSKLSEDRPKWFGTPF